jgi:hypothetical protein
VNAPAPETIYVALGGQGADAWRPVQAIRRAGDTFLIVSKNDDPEDEEWEFGSGCLVRCEERQLAGATALVAVALVTATSPKLAIAPSSG